MSNANPVNYDGVFTIYDFGDTYWEKLFPVGSKFEITVSGTKYRFKPGRGVHADFHEADAEIHNPDPTEPPQLSVHFPISNRYLFLQVVRKGVGRIVSLAAEPGHAHSVTLDGQSPGALDGEVQVQVHGGPHGVD